MRIAIIGNGPVESRYSAQLTHYDYIIAADGGNRHCNRFGIVPHEIIGDGDSTTATFTINPDQTTSDLQKALTRAHTIAPTSEIDLYGVISEERLDHTLTAMMLLTNQKTIKHIFTDHWDIQYLTAINTVNITAPISSAVSIIPQTASAKLNLTGLQWSGLVTLTADNSGISNTVISSPAQVIVVQGAIILLQQLWN